MINRCLHAGNQIKMIKRIKVVKLFVNDLSKEKVDLTDR